jgi:2-polyprenyl-6-hydroxyphenyl methylase/3-demethylubiquinone-9 3-methyltransferase
LLVARKARIEYPAFRIPYRASLGKMSETSMNGPYGLDSSNVDREELSKFAALAPIWWDRNGAFKALHDINGLRVGYINGRAPLAGRKVLDLGCGGGILSEAMAAMGAKVTGLDAGEEPLAVARLHLKESGLRVDYRLALAEPFAERAAESFDVVTCMELLEHVPDPGSVVAACARLVIPGGDVFFATLNRNFKSFLFAIIGAEYVLRLVKRGTHSYRRFIKPSELERWGDAGRLALLDITGLHYNPFTRRYSLGGNTHVNYLMHFRKTTLGRSGA